MKMEESQDPSPRGTWAETEPLHIPMDESKLQRVGFDEQNLKARGAVEQRDENSQHRPLLLNQQTSRRCYTSTTFAPSYNGRYRLKSWRLPVPNSNGDFMKARDLGHEPEHKHPFITIRDSMETKLGVCVAAILAYMILGVIAFSFVFERWPVVDSLYFSVVTFTTVGYGDVYPTTTGGRLFTCVFALGGIAFLGIALGVIGNNLLAADLAAVHTESHEQRKSLRKTLVKRLSIKGIDDDEGIPFAKNDASSMSRHRHLHERIRMYCEENMPNFLKIVLALVVGSCIVGWGNGWTWSDAIYYCVITASTVGYGDLSPDSSAMRWYALIYIPVSVGVTGVMLGGVAVMVMNRKRKKIVDGIVQHDITVEELALLDGNGDGSVTRLDFIQFMLVGMDIVDRDTLQELHDLFSRLDVDNNEVLQRHDLELIAEQRQNEPC